MKTYDYYCTWQAQNIYCQDKKVSNRDYLDEEALFGNNGIVFAHPKFRNQLHFILDDGWDVPYSYNVFEDYPFASHEIKNDRFPSLKGDPKEKLKQLVDKITSYGWKGVGIWVCAQGSGEHYHKTVAELKDFIIERLEWSKYAGVTYWKVDWGIYDSNVKFRKMISDLASNIYPELIIEHAKCMSPVNGFNDDEEKALKYKFPWNQKLKKYLDEVTKFSNVIRSYDVTEELSSTSTLARLTYLLKQKDAIINAEDELYMGVILGCSLGIERNKDCCKSKITPETSFHYRANEVIAALKYRQISPCFTGGKIHISKQMFLDEWQFNDYWHENVTNNLVKQMCPSKVSRNTSLPEVKAIKDVPYVICCKDFNHNYSVGTFKRLNYENGDNYFVDITIKIDEIVNHIAIFSNHINNLIVSFNENINVKDLILCDLINNDEISIKDKIKIYKNKLYIPYNLLTNNFVCDDNSSKAYLIRIIK